MLIIIMPNIFSFGGFSRVLKLWANKPKNKTLLKNDDEEFTFLTMVPLAFATWHETKEVVFCGPSIRQYGANNLPKVTMQQLGSDLNVQPSD